jgi:predicted Fe-Mo cluster-binding NifX family protein
MGKIGLTLSRNTLDAPLARHFGMAKWLLMYENDQAFEFVQNTELYGRGVTDEFIRAGCVDAVFTNIGRGALEKLQAARIRPWYGPPDVPVREVIECLKRGELQEATEATEKRQPRHRHGQR